jgi:hypothetical protein
LGPLITRQSFVAKDPAVGIIFRGNCWYATVSDAGVSFKLDVTLKGIQYSAFPRKEEICSPLHFAIGVAV